MLKRFLLYMFSGLLLVSCYTFNKPDKPKHLISKKEMINIIIDLKLLASSSGSNKKILEDHGVYSVDYIYKKYHIDSSTFASNNNYYAYYIDDYDAIYTKVSDSLNELSKFYKELEDKEFKEKIVRDSINFLRKKDSLNLLKKKDSLKLLKKDDSILGVNLKDKIKPKLIEPVSDKAAQSQ